MISGGGCARAESHHHAFFSAGGEAVQVNLGCVGIGLGARERRYVGERREKETKATGGLHVARVKSRATCLSPSSREIQSNLPFQVPSFSRNFILDSLIGPGAI